MVLMRHPVPRRRDDAWAVVGGARPKAANVRATHTHRTLDARLLGIEDPWRVTDVTLRLDDENAVVVSA